MISFIYLFIKKINILLFIINIITFQNTFKKLILIFKINIQFIKKVLILLRIQKIIKNIMVIIKLIFSIKHTFCQIVIHLLLLFRHKKINYFIYFSIIIF